MTKRNVTKYGEGMPAGRPTVYTDDMPERVEAFMSLGYSRMAAAGDLGICYDTFHEWVKEKPKFSEAVKRGMAKRLKFLEDGLLAAETSPKVTSRIFALKNAAPQEWADRHISPNDPENPMSATVVVVTMTPQEAAEAYARTLNPDKG
ncbi:MAG: hypothetical protein U5N55_10795 [Cypionkella sp.]|nr:hypothetical protein [Cypionkella sp.]